MFTYIYTQILFFVREDMTQLFLCSSFADVAEFLPNCVKNLHGMKVAFIPTAAEVEKVTFYVKK